MYMEKMLSANFTTSLLCYFCTNYRTSIRKCTVVCRVYIMLMGKYANAAIVSNAKHSAPIGRDILLRGGKAVDAAIAVTLCDSVLCPEYLGLGGGFLMTLYNSETKTPMTIDAREVAPAAATPSMFCKNQINSQIGSLAIGVPGQLKGYWTAFNKFGGGVSWKSLFEPAIQMCEEGISISKREYFLNKETGTLKKMGDRFRMLKLAETLKIIALNGADYFYNGPLASRIANEVQNAGGILSFKDLNDYTKFTVTISCVRIEKPFSVNLENGYRLYAGHPPSSGVILAFILKLLNGIFPTNDASLNAHKLMEAYKFAYGERSHLGDHKFEDVSEIYRKINSASYIKNIQNKMSNRHTSNDPKFYGANFYTSVNCGTANVSVLDSMGNAVAITSTINTVFGCRFVSPSTGIILNSEMNDFSIPSGAVNFFGIPPSSVNFIKPHKRPMSSMCPSIITDVRGDVAMVLGAAGGSKSTLATAYVIALTLCGHKTLKQSLDEPRLYHQLMPMQIEFECGIPNDVLKQLIDIGHSLTRVRFKSGSSVTAIHKNSTGTITAAADFRRPGSVSGY